MEETWKDIPSLRGSYQASTKGRIKSLSRKVNSRHSAGRIVKEKILKPIKCANGYYVVNITIGFRKQYLVHRLIAETFLRSNECRKHVNHLDFDKSNNSVLNLEWCTVQENITHSCIGERNGRVILNTQSGIFYHSCVEILPMTGLSINSVRKMLMGKTVNRTNFIYV